MSAPALDRLFARPLERNAGVRVLCFPYAGGTSAAFEGFSAELPDWVDVCAYEPPGRQQRASEPLARSMDELLSPLIEHADRLCELPCVLVGYSLGGWMAFELARKLRRLGLPGPRALVLACSRAPERPRRRALSRLPDADFIAELRRMNGTPAAVLEDADMMAYVLPRVRADFALGEHYTPAEEPPLSAAFVVVGGLEDPTVSPADLQAWRRHCAGSFQLQLLRGDHFFIHGQRRALTKLIARALALDHAAPRSHAIPSAEDFR